MVNVNKKKRGRIVPKNIALKPKNVVINQNIVSLFLRKTINNIFMTACLGFNKNVIYTYSMGQKYSGSKRMAPTAMESCGEEFAKQLSSRGYVNIVCVLLSPGFFMTNILKGFQHSPLRIHDIIPRYKYGHNGMRLKKIRRVL
jgi:ribosomal protein S11